MYINVDHKYKVRKTISTFEITDRSESTMYGNELIDLIIKELQDKAIEGFRITDKELLFEYFMNYDGMCVYYNIEEYEEGGE